ncbi:hypothetical protein GTO89_02935 [Heliobacterium gestii]|uniref:DUF4440 domain-containing protein n=1 Tax=Heliomicrobium gestii TaxID=2699 RepID=A0A845LBE7_HELGE|nr:hypothetical protein [Heliomicrobium gestii]MBM7865742.1 hypothetical protein [Heliomicrobium gestii]MZP41989.1 hypothetical protein [Heliomicrobium gestii]
MGRLHLLPLLLLAFLFLSLSPTAGSAVSDRGPLPAESLPRSPAQNAPSPSIEVDTADWDDHRLITFALEADKQMATALFVQNPDWLRHQGLTPVSIAAKNDLSRLLAPYWTSESIDTVWEEGSRAMPELPWGFYSEGPSLLFLAKDVTVSHPSADTAVVSGTTEAYQSENGAGAPSDNGRDSINVSVYLRQTPTGWRAECHRPAEDGV